MAKHASFDMNKFERSIFSFTGSDGRLLLVKMPKKRTFEAISQLQTAAKDNIGAFTEILDSLLSEALSNNQQGREITPEQLSEMYNFEEKMEILNQYIRFLSAALQDPN